MPFISSIRRNYEIERQNNKNFEIIGGDSVYTIGGYRVHTFTSVGDSEFLIKRFSNSNPNILSLTSGTLRVEAFLVGGGASAGSIGGGGGAGGAVYTNNLNLSIGPTSVTVGAGGAEAPHHPGPPGDNGANSVFGTYIALGGGRSASWANNIGGQPGGCGGGGTGTPGTGTDGGAGAQPGQALPQGGVGVGFPGAKGGISPSGSFITGAGTWTGGGGGGAGSAGGFENWNSLNDSRFNPDAGRAGGNGIRSTITGASNTYAGGGGGCMHSSGYNSPFLTSRGGLGGGGSGSSFDREYAPAGRGQAGTQNTGGGGGGGFYTTGGTGGGGAGGPGIVVVRYLI
jgi:hypothetical protein